MKQWKWQIWKKPSTAWYKQFLTPGRNILQDLYVLWVKHLSVPTRKCRGQKETNYYCSPNPKEGCNWKACILITASFDLSQDIYYLLQTMTYQEPKYFWHERLSYANSQHKTSQQTALSKQQLKSIIMSDWENSKLPWKKHICHDFV